MSLSSPLRGEKGPGFETRDLPLSVFPSANSTTIISSPQRPYSLWPLAEAVLLWIPALIVLVFYGSGAGTQEAVFKTSKSLFLRNTAAWRSSNDQHRAANHHCANALFWSLPRHPQCTPTSPQPLRPCSLHGPGIQVALWR